MITFVSVKRESNMKKYLFLLFSLPLLTACHESLEDKAEREADEFTKKNCPIAVSENIVNDSMKYEKETRTIHYFYTICGKADTTAINKQQAKEELIKGVKDAMTIRTYKEHGFNFAYTYFSAKNKGQILIDVKVTPKDYNGK